MKESLKEVMCAVIGALILAGAALMVHEIYQEAGRSGPAFVAEAYQRHTQILNLVLAFAGTVVGYYFGRVPAEKLAASAQAQAKESATREGAAVQAQERLKDGIRGAKGDLSGALPPAGGATPSPQATAVQSAFQRLDNLL